MALEGPLIQQAEGCLTRPYDARLQDLIEDLIEVTVIDADISTCAAGLELPEQVHLRLAYVDEMEVPQPWRIALQLSLKDQLRRVLVDVEVLRPGEPIDVGPMSGDQDEVVQVALDEARFAVGPHRQPWRLEPLG